MSQVQELFDVFYNYAEKLYLPLKQCNLQSGEDDLLTEAVNLVERRLLGLLFPVIIVAQKHQAILVKLVAL